MKKKYFKIEIPFVKKGSFLTILICLKLNNND